MTTPVADLRGSALCPVEVAVDLADLSGIEVVVDLPPPLVVAVELCPPEA